MKDATKYSPKVAARAMRMIPELWDEKKVLKNALLPASNLIFSVCESVKAEITKYNDSTTR